MGRQGGTKQCDLNVGLKMLENIKQIKAGEYMDESNEITIDEVKK